MATSTFQRATKRQARARVALIGPSGSGKTYSALAIARGLGERVALIDTERGSASKYAGLFPFDVLELETFAPVKYVEAITSAEEAGYDVLVIDSLSHAWAGKEGLLEFVDAVQKRNQSGNSFAAWREATPLHNRLVDTMIGARLHVIATMRAKTEYVMEQGKGGKMVPRKVGLAPVQRDGMEYEFDVVADLDLEHNMIVSKTRCPALDPGREGGFPVIPLPGENVASILREWLTDGAPIVEATRTIGDVGRDALMELARVRCEETGIPLGDVKAYLVGLVKQYDCGKVANFTDEQGAAVRTYIMSLEAPEGPASDPFGPPEGGGGDGVA